MKDVTTEDTEDTEHTQLMERRLWSRSPGAAVLRDLRDLRGENRRPYVGGER